MFDGFFWLYDVTHYNICDSWSWSIQTPTKISIDSANDSSISKNLPHSYVHTYFHEKWIFCVLAKHLFSLVHHTDQSHVWRHINNLKHKSPFLRGVINDNTRVYYIFPSLNSNSPSLIHRFVKEYKSTSSNTT